LITTITNIITGSNMLIFRPHFALTDDCSLALGLFLPEFLNISKEAGLRINDILFAGHLSAVLNDLGIAYLRNGASNQSRRLSENSDRSEGEAG
jgi:hypothetical protein